MGRLPGFQAGDILLYILFTKRVLVLKDLQDLGKVSLSSFAPPHALNQILLSSGWYPNCLFF